MLPIFLLSLLAIYIIIDRTLVLNKLGKKDSSWMSRIIELISEGKNEKALKFAVEKPYSSGKVIAAGLKESKDTPIQDIEESMQLEARQQISIMERMMNYLGITASIAPMLGFLGTIFGVIRIFYDIAASGILDISTISNGLYEKMICSGAGLFVGIIAYSGFYVLNGRIDKIVLRMDKDSNEALRAMKSARRGEDIKVKEYED
jgi:biopolymer transport protein ExbB